jgi:hypothetical protein
MAINTTLRLASEVIHIIVDGNNLMILDSNNTLTTLDGIKFSHSGVLKEFPDLKDNEDWRKIALERLKNHIRSFKTDMEKTIYIKDELVKFGGYEPLFYQQAGFRPQKFK